MSSSRCRLREETDDEDSANRCCRAVRVCRCAAKPRSSVAARACRPGIDAGSQGANGWIATAVEEDLLDALTRISSIEALAIRDHNFAGDPIAASAMRLHVTVTPAGGRVSIRLIVSNASGAIQHERDHDLAVTELPRFVVSHLLAFLEAQIVVTAGDRDACHALARAPSRRFGRTHAVCASIGAKKSRIATSWSCRMRKPRSSSRKRSRAGSAICVAASGSGAGPRGGPRGRCGDDGVSGDGENGPDHVLALIAAVQFLLEREEYVQAVQLAGRAVALNPSQRIARALLAEALVLAGRLEQAKALLSELCTASTPDPGDELARTMRRMSPA